jgi:hypothetical protein
MKPTTRNLTTRYYDPKVKWEEGRRLTQKGEDERAPTKEWTITILRNHNKASNQLTKNQNWINLRAKNQTRKGERNNKREREQKPY